MNNINILSSLLKDYVAGKVAGIYVSEIRKRKSYENLSISSSENPHIVDYILSELIETGNQLIHLHLLKNINLSSDFIEKIAENSTSQYVSSLIVKHNNVSLEVLNKLALSNDDKVKSAARKTIVQHPNISLRRIEELELTYDITYTVRIAAREAVAKHSDTSSEILEKLAFDAESQVRKAVALRSDLLPQLIVKMAADRQIIAKKFLLRNRSFSANLLSTLAQSSEAKVLQMVGLHPNTSVSLLKKLATVPSASSFVAQNPNVTREIIQKLVQSDNQEVYLSLAKNYKTPSDILANLAIKNSDAKVLIPIVENNNTPDNIKIKILAHLSKIPNYLVRKYVAQNTCTPENILIDWAKSKAFVKLYPAIARNPNTPVSGLDIFAKKFCSKQVAISLSENPNTPKEIIEYLANKYRAKYYSGCFYNRVRCAIAMNIHAPEYTRNNLKICLLNGKSIFYLVENINIFGDDLLQLIRYEDKYDRFLLHNNHLPLRILEYLLERQSGSRHTCDRKFVTRHPKTPAHILEKLTLDKDRGIRDAAKYRLEQRDL